VPSLIFAQAENFRNGYIETYTAGLDHSFGDVDLSLSYVGTEGVQLANEVYPNNYAGASPALAPFTLFDAAGHVRGGIGMEALMANPGHSTFHAGTASVVKSSARLGLGFQASYTFSKSLDNSSTVLAGGFGANSGPVLQAPPQDPRKPSLDKAPS